MSKFNGANQEVCVDMSSKSYGYWLAIPNVLEMASETKLSVSSYCIDFFTSEFSTPVLHQRTDDRNWI